MGVIYDPDWLARPDWLTAIFTGALFLATSGLWVFTALMWLATKRAAEASKLAADALPIVERAYVYPEVIAVGPLNEIIERARVFYLGDWDKRDTPAKETVDVSVRIKNYGKTPAILKTLYVAFGVDPQGSLIGQSIPESVLGAGETTSLITCYMETGITPNQAGHIFTYTAHIAFYGEITFADIWGIEHTTEFYFVWDKDISRLILKFAKTEQGNRNYPQ